MNDNREPLLDFTMSPTTPTSSVQEVKNPQGVHRTLNNSVQTEVKYLDKPKREIVEIRVFFDDGTWESLVPKK